MQFVDLKAQYRVIEQDVKRRIDAVLEHGRYILGPEVLELEERLASYVGAKYCVSCASGTDALLMALIAKGVGPGDAVFTTPFTFIATAEVISLVGATPVFVDIEPATYNIDPPKLREAVEDLKSGKRPAVAMPDGLTAKAVIPVDLFGLPADYDAIRQIADEHDLFVLEDAAQSFGAEYKGRKACALAEIAATSFFPAKPLGCYGDGGALFTDDEDLATIFCSIRVHGKGTDKYDNVRIGINGRLDTIQAAVLLAKMDILDDEMDRRRAVASRYVEGLSQVVHTPLEPSGLRSAWAQFCVLSDHREKLQDSLGKANIPTAVYYPGSLHLQQAFSSLGYAKGAFPVAEDISGRIFALPMHPYLAPQEQDRVVDVVCGSSRMQRSAVPLVSTSP